MINGEWSRRLVKITRDYERSTVEVDRREGRSKHIFNKTRWMVYVQDCMREEKGTKKREDITCFLSSTRTPVFPPKGLSIGRG